MSSRTEPRATSRSTTGGHAPIVLRRLLALRQAPFLADAELSELVLLAENVVESSFAKGESVMPSGRPLSVHYVLRGRVARAAHTTLGLLEALARRDLTTPLVAISDVDTLEIDVADLFELLEEHFGLLRHLLRELAARALDLPPRWTDIQPRSAPIDRPLGLVDRMTFIRQHLPLFSARMQPLAILAHAARELSWRPGEVIAHAGAHDRDVIILVEGNVLASSEGDEPRRLGPGAVIGALEVLASRPHPHDATAITHVRAITLAPDAIFDVLEDSAELGLAVAGELAAAILDAAPQGARATTAESNS